MTLQLLLALLTLLTATVTPFVASRATDAPIPERVMVAAAPVASPLASDSALDELAAGRFWHAARILRAEGAAEGDASDRLTLARAEAGWSNWLAVRELLEGADWLEDEGGGLGLYLLGRALEAEERWTEAAAAQGRYARVVGVGALEAVPALVRRTRALWRAGLVEEALASLAEARGSTVAASWTAVEMALNAAEAGDTTAARRLRAHILEPGARDAAWRVEADALLGAGDSARAAASFRALAGAMVGSRRANAAVELGRLTLAAGDSAEARSLLLGALEEARGPARTRAAEALIDLGGLDLDLTLELARMLDRSGDGWRALRGYGRALRLADESGMEAPEWVRLERARLMATVADLQDDALEEFRAIHETTTNERIGARNLDVWALMRSRQRLPEQVRTLRRWLVERYPSSPEAAEVVWGRGFEAESRERYDDAVEHYAFVAEHARAHHRAGEARMRMGQIHLRRANPEVAGEVYEAYLSDFPEGRRWQEAAYWAGRIRLELGDTAAGRAHLMRVLREQPIEYYAVMAADLLGVPYTLDLPAGEEPTEPGWLTVGLARLDLLTESGLSRGASEEVDRLRDRARGSRAVTLRLAEALIERGRTVDGINLGWALLAEDNTWDGRLLRIAYPFPYRELVIREAREWGIDPIMMAAIIRQESAFKSDIVSHAGAVGLMQVMPPTGAQLARAHGPRGFTEASLRTPEVNLHLGAAFFVEMSRRYEGALPLVLSAYNAGPTRANRWRRYPEAGDPTRFTERIPIDETRGYVKSVRRNLGLYRILYGQ
jgi:soluble lytic murein transglycosylase